MHGWGRRELQEGLMGLRGGRVEVGHAMHQMIANSHSLFPYRRHLSARVDKGLQVRHDEGTKLRPQHCAVTRFSSDNNREI